MNKLTLTAIAAFLISGTTYGQGTVNFANRLPGVFDAPILLPPWPGVFGIHGAGEMTTATVQLLLVNGTSVSSVGSPIGFRGTSGELAKYFDGGQVEIPGTSPGGTVTLRVSVRGMMFPYLNKDSANFSQTLGGGTLPPENMVNFAGFAVAAIPEPTTITLGMLGTAALLAFRKRQ